LRLEDSTTIGSFYTIAFVEDAAFHTHQSTIPVPIAAMNASNSLDTLNAGMSTPNHFVMWNTEGIAVLVCSTLTIYNALELVLLILTTFQAYVGIYFWSLIFATMGLIPYTLGFMTEYFQWSYLALGIGIDTFGWILMVSGQSVVLYSRLHILFHQGGYKRLLTCIKMMIIINAVIMHVTTCGTP
jgi:hypothetical protein